MKKHKRKKSMVQKSNKNKILIVGHEYSDYEKVEDLLNVSGLQKAQALKKEKINANEISRIIVNAEAINNNDLSKKIKQVKVNPIWNGLALDLLMSNADQSFWGWSDTNAVSLLNYWKALDSKIFFIFVYDTPENLLSKLLEKEQNITTNRLDEELNKWLSYNKTLLKFHNRNKDRSLLVSSGQIVLNSQASLNQISHKAGMIELKSDTLIVCDNDVSSSPDDLLHEHLLSKVLEEQPDIVNLFDELQAVADPSLTQSTQKKFTAMEALQTFNAHQNKNNEKIYDLEKENKELLQNIKKQTELANIYSKKTSQHEKWLECKVVEEERLEKHIDDVNHKFIEQIFDLQENLEEYYISKEKTVEKNKEITEMYELGIKKEKQLKKWLECKSTEEDRLEKYINTLKEEKSLVHIKKSK